MRIVTVALGLLLVGSALGLAQEPEVELEVVEARQLSVISLDGGAKVEFLEPEPGVVFVVEEGAFPAEPVLPALQLPENATAADVHRALAPDQPVPPAVRVATLAIAQEDQTSEEERELEISETGQAVQLAVATEPAEPAEPAIAAAPVEPAVPAIQAAPAKPKLQAVPARPVVKAVPAKPAQPAAPVQPKKDENKAGEQEKAEPPKPMSETRAEWFQGKFCKGGARKNWCWINRTGKSKKQFWGIAIGSTVYSCGGTARFKVQYKSFGKWKTYVSRDVLPGYYYSVTRVGAPRTRRSQVEGYCFHHAGAGA